MLSLLVIRGPLSVQEIATVFGASPSQVLPDLDLLTMAIPGLYQDDCPHGCADAVCYHAPMRLDGPAAADLLFRLADAMGLVARRTHDPRTEDPE